jgi:hypothetical protein
VKRSTPLKRTGFKRTGQTDRAPLASLDRSKAGTRPRRLKSTQRPVTAAERLYWDRLASVVGCIACRVAGRPVHSLVSIHHIDGRTKPGCHMLVLPLCAGCHQDGTGNDKSLVAVHPYKAAFEALYGTQLELKARCDLLLGGP